MHKQSEIEPLPDWGLFDCWRVERQANVDAAYYLACSNHSEGMARQALQILYWTDLGCSDTDRIVSAVNDWPQERRDALVRHAECSGVCP